MPTLHWIGKEKVVNHHQEVPYRVLEKQYEFNTESGSSENKIIQGDNLEALKSLLPEYEGRINCIYIDPPYNTGNENWVYNDNVNHPKIKKWLGETVGKEGEDLSRHDKWLCMMYPRLKLLNKLLSKEGKMVISIGHHELVNLILICKEIFSNKQILPITIQTSGGKPSSGFNFLHEYLLFIVPNSFSPNSSNISGGKSRSPFEGLTLATFNKVQRPNQTYPIFIEKASGRIIGTGKSLAERIKEGIYLGSSETFQFDFNEAPEGTEAVWPITSKGEECVWRLIPSRLLSDWEKGYIKVSPNRQLNSLNKFSVQYLPSGLIKKIEKGQLEVSGVEDNSPTLKFGENTTAGSQVPTIWLDKSFYTVKGTNVLMEIFSKKNFNYPKSPFLIKEILTIISDKNDIILDSFAGSGTTGHASLELNKEDGGKRKFLLIEMEDYGNSLTAERIKKVIQGYGSGIKAVEGTGGDFGFYALGPALFDTEGNLNEAVAISDILSYIWYSETRTKWTPPVDHADRYYLGSLEDTAYYFIYEPDRLTTLDFESLSAWVTQPAEQYICYADNCLLPEALMQKHRIIFKKIPRDITRF
ncbi:site-specific DNA-methyltransferase [Algoriphagus confluentis]|uniref:Site-specific DNA-methyltransferase n=2 Tax=Algoriphagus confluentis TaxID=1697556 RepID=A0ABQ6PWS9_9BACT|nr:site-specific DNA-methyltransferase [Algoriphagus confluentis]